MSAAILTVCVDPRLNQEAVRYQLRQRLAEAAPPADNVFVLADVGGNVGSAVRNTISLLRHHSETIVVAGVLHHDDCKAAAAGLRQPLDTSIRAMEAELRRAGFNPPLLAGEIVTATSAIVWADQPPQSLEVLTFRMPRMYG
jgi:hypothetical protein